MSENCT